jgi:ribosome-binding protein aMBF1 (putative translation factor)
MSGERRDTPESKPKCEYCGKILMVQDEEGRNADGNKVVLETDGSQKRACKNCADRLSQQPRLNRETNPRQQPST